MKGVHFVLGDGSSEIYVNPQVVWTVRPDGDDHAIISAAARDQYRVVGSANETLRKLGWEVKDA